MWTPTVVSIMYFIVAIIFIPLGVLIFIQSTRLGRTINLRYDNFGNCDIGPNSTTETVGTCIVPFSVNSPVKAPSYFYYGVVNFYQNARRFVKSRSDQQLRGFDNPDTAECKPLDKDPITENDIVPCGLVARSQFNDSFELCKDAECDQFIKLEKKGIAWDVDRKNRFLGNNDSFTDSQNQQIRDEDFMVWMRTSAYKDWKKLYRIIDEDLEPNTTYYVRISSRFPVKSFGGQKFFFVSDTTWFGGPNRALGIAYMSVGGFVLVLGILILLRSRITPDLALPPETTVLLDGMVDEVDLPKPGFEQRSDKRA